MDVYHNYDQIIYLVALQVYLEKWFNGSCYIAVILEANKICFILVYKNVFSLTIKSLLKIIIGISERTYFTIFFNV